jgi:two-component system, NtrC family, nitrogen regulation sensor histidine kinase NtrY
MVRRRQPLTHEESVFLLALAGGAPAVLIALLLLWTGGYSAKVQWTAGLLVGAVWLTTAFAVRARVVRPLQTLSNLLAALREGDYSIRARGAGGDDALGLAFAEVNAIGTPLREQRLGALEAGALLRTVMEEIDVAVVAVDGDRRVRLVNRAAERMLGSSAARLLGRDARDVGLGPCLEGAPRRVIEALFPAGGGSSAAAPSARAGSRSSSSSSPTSAAPCARRSARCGSGSCAC